MGRCAPRSLVLPAVTIVCAVILHSHIQACWSHAVFLAEREASSGTQTEHLALRYRLFKSATVGVFSLVPGSSWRIADEVRDRSTWLIAGVWVVRPTERTAAPIIATLGVLCGWWAVFAWAQRLAIMRRAKTMSGDARSISALEQREVRSPGMRRGAAAAGSVLADAGIQIVIWIVPMVLVWNATTAFPGRFPVDELRLIGPWPWAVVGPPLGFATVMLIRQAWSVLVQIWGWVRGDRWTAGAECAACGYSLDGLRRKDVCPECGKPPWKRPILRLAVEMAWRGGICALVIAAAVLAIFVSHGRNVGGPGGIILSRPLFPNPLQGLHQAIYVLWPETQEPVVLLWEDATAVIITRRTTGPDRVGMPGIRHAWAYGSRGSDGTYSWTYGSGPLGAGMNPGSGYLLLKFPNQRTIWSSVLSGSGCGWGNCNQGRIGEAPRAMTIDGSYRMMPREVRMELERRLE